MLWGLVASAADLAATTAAATAATTAATAAATTADLATAKSKVAILTAGASGAVGLASIAYGMWTSRRVKRLETSNDNVQQKLDIIIGRLAPETAETETAAETPTKTPTPETAKTAKTETPETAKTAKTETKTEKADSKA